MLAEVPNLHSAREENYLLPSGFRGALWRQLRPGKGSGVRSGMKEIRSTHGSSLEWV